MDKIQILVVDDNETVRTLLKISLKKENYEVFEATDGVSGYEMVESIHPKLIISDILMPNMDGFEFCRKVREESSDKSVPFIFLSSLSEISTELRGYRTGADDYLVKSNLKKHELLDKIESLLKKTEQYHTIEAKMDDGLVGRLAEMSMIEIIQLLALNKKSGVLKVSSDDQAGEIYFNDGHLTHAVIGEIKGERAIHKMVEFEKGIFRFLPNGKGDDIPQTITNSAMNVIMDCCRILDEKRLKSDQ